MASGDEVNNKEVSAPKEHKFGVHELSDVVFIVGEQRFHCHKMFLAARSNYFAGMFTSDFKEKNQNEVRIDANPRAFRWLMEILYDGQMTNYRYLLDCDARWEDYPLEDNKGFCGCDAASAGKTCSHSTSTSCWIWRATSFLLDLADRFLVFDIVCHSIDLLMVHCNQSLDNKDCIQCATKYLLSLHYKLDEYEAVNASSKSMILEVLSELNKGGEKFEMSSEALEKFVKRK